MKLDQTDIALLNKVQEDNQTSAAQLGQKVGVSASSVTRRLQRLRADGLIERDVAILNRAIGRRRVSAVCHVELERHTMEMFDQLKAQLVALPQVQVCMAVSGQVDLIVILNTRDLDEMTELVDELFSKNPGVRRCTSSIVKKTWKSHFAFPVTADDL